MILMRMKIIRLGVARIPCKQRIGLGWIRVENWIGGFPIPSPFIIIILYGLLHKSPPFSNLLHDMFIPRRMRFIHILPFEVGFGFGSMLSLD